MEDVENENDFDDIQDPNKKYKHLQVSNGSAQTAPRPFANSVAVEGYTDDYDTAPAIFESIDLGHREESIKIKKKTIRKGRGEDADAACCNGGGCQIF